MPPKSHGRAQAPAQNGKRPRSKHEERTEATQLKLLAAAQDVFTRDGYASARLEQIAIEAGYTRGAIYAHYKSKEDLFLALFEQRVQATRAEFQQMLDAQSSSQERLLGLRSMLVKKAADKSWAMLVLEFKLFALRQPKLKTRMQKLMAMLHGVPRAESLSMLFGEVSTKQARRIERRLALLGAILSAAALESHFRPELLSGKDLDATLEEIFEAVVRK